MNRAEAARSPETRRSPPAVLALAAALLLADPGLAVGSPPVSSDPPSPEEFLGYDPIAEARAVGPAQVAGYLRALAAASPRVRVKAIGLTTDGWPLEMAAVSDPRNLDAARGAPPAIPVLLTCSLHADEVGPALMSLRLLHRLAAGKVEGADRILRELVLLAFPTANPDGLDLVERSAGGARAWPGPLPALYHRFAGHDNNRDWLLFTQVETRAFARLLETHRPLLWIDVHQMGRFGPRLFLPPYAPPINPRIPAPLLARADSLGLLVAERLGRAGKTGLTGAASFDTWSPARSYPFFHGASRLLIEVAGMELFRPVDADRPPRSWGIPEVVDYSLAAVETALQAVSEDPDRWRGGAGATAGGDSRSEGYFIPAEMGDPWAAREVLAALRVAGARVSRSEDGWTVAAPADGPTGLDGWLQSLLSCTPYPMAPKSPVPYDGTCHDLAHLAGVKALRSALKAGGKAIDGPLSPIPGTLLPGGAAGGTIIETRSLGVLREAVDLILEGHQVQRTLVETSACGRPFPAGSLLGVGAPRPWLERLTRETGAHACAAPDPAPRASRLRTPRVGVLSAAGPSIDEGWTRWVLEEFRIPFRSVRDLEAGLEGLDVLVAPEDTLPADGGVAARARARAGIETVCVEGGRVVALGTSARKIASWMRLPLQDLTEDGAAGASIRPGGVLLRARPTAAGASHPLLAGVGEEAALYFTEGPIWKPRPRDGRPGRPETSPCLGLLEFPPGGSVLCGSMIAGEAPAGALALVEVRRGRGELFILGFRPQFRGWTLGSLRILLNAVLREERSP